MKRPVGLILTYLVLGPIAGLQLLGALGMAFVVYTVSYGAVNHGAAANTMQAEPSPVSAGALSAIFVLTALVCFLLAAWSITTLIGLIRIRNWARWSILAIASCMLGLSLLGILGSVVAASFAPFQANPNLSTSTMHAMLLVQALFYAGFALVAAWWLVYFNLRSTRNYFLPVYTSGYASAAAVGPGFATAPPPPLPAMANDRSRLPGPILVLAVLFFISTLMFIPSLFLQYPIFAFGFLVPPAGAHALYVILMVVNILIGVGLLRLDNRARLAVFAVIGVGVAQSLVLATPWGSGRMHLLMQQIFATMPVRGDGWEGLLDSHLLWVLTAVFWVAVYGTVVWVLQRYRGHFVSALPSVAIGS